MLKRTALLCFFSGTVAAPLGACKTNQTSVEGAAGALASGPAGGSGAAKALAPQGAEKAPPESGRAAETPLVGEVATKIESHFAGKNSQRIYVQVDKPLYQPGETIWIKTWDLKLRDFSGGGANGIHYELVSPKGATVVQKYVQQDAGMATNDFVIPEGVEGGEYSLRVRTDDGVSETRPVVVSAYEAPRLKKKLEFLRKAYGPGDEVSATVKVERPTGEVLAGKKLQGVIMLDDRNLPNVEATTDGQGGAVVKFKLPDNIDKGDGLLTVLVQDGGITESISKRVPIVLKKLQLSVFPEGGDLVEGLQSRIYFEAQTMLGKPADMEGKIVDDQGQTAALLRTHHFGLGRGTFTPAPGRTYHVEVTQPVGIDLHYPLPAVKPEGCVLRTFDDYDGVVPELRVGVMCSTDKDALLTAVVRENLFDAARVQVKAGRQAVVYLKAKTKTLAKAQGIARVTLFDENKNPLAERVVFRNRRNGLVVKVEPDAESYSPREQVALTVRTEDSEGQPVPAEVALSVVDDTVVSFADDKTGHLLSRVLFEQDIPGKVEEPKFFFDVTEAKAPAALDMLMGTRGWRHFVWQPVFSPPPPSMPLGAIGSGMGGGGARPRPMPRRGIPAMEMAEGALPPEAAMALPAPPPAMPKGAMPQPPGAPAAMRMPAAPPVAQAKPVARADVADRAVAAPEKKKIMMKEEAEAPRDQAPAQAVGGLRGRVAGKRARAMDDELAALDADEAVANNAIVRRPRPMGFAPVREFPAPKYTGAFDGVRTDFRETIAFAPRVRTDNKGKGIVTFYLSDAVTSFRVFAEGVGGAQIGRAEKVFKSSLPFSMSVKLPLEVSAGDQMLLPLTLSNERSEALPVTLTSSFGDLIDVTQNPDVPKQLGARARSSLFYGVTVKGQPGESKVSFAAQAGGLKDEFSRTLTVVPLGFPQTVSRSGSVKGQAQITFDTGAALPGSMDAKLTIYTSPTATLLSGLDGMIREPYGCFEQTSSTNYPNVMVLSYLKTQNVVAPDLLNRTNQMIERGYQKLVGFETGEKGYEWFGQAPAHEALSAYGVLEFADMQKAWGGVSEPMVARTVAYLKTRRDGKGGFARNPRALDSFGGAKPEITDAYIVYAFTEAGYFDLVPEIAAQAQVARDTRDPYLLALATNTLLNVPQRKSEGMAAAARLVSMQDKTTGKWTGADHSITRSTGYNLDVETTSLALLALLKTKAFAGEVQMGIKYLVGARQGHGDWGATQSTVLALKALTTYTVASKQMASSGQVQVMVNGRVVATQSYEAGRKEPLVLQGWGSALTAGTNAVQIIHNGQNDLPYSLAVDFRSARPASDPATVVDLETKLAKTSVKMGETVRVVATIKNKTSSGQPMTMAIIGLPGGLAFQNWQLKELVDNKVIGFFETRPREVIVYLRDMKPNEVKEVPLDLVATVPGNYTGPASRAYLYYSNDKRTWIDPLKVQIAP
ncbi:MAG: MG2 domain-containing protein [Deltaproteobacteria bacterium]|nr:MG2 domain-containing protein [Deltaproteobacteria bacterium]